jgi:hypothetical protein
MIDIPVDYTTRYKDMKNSLSFLTLFLFSTAFASPADFITWTLAEDPPDINLNANATATTATLTATGPVPNAYDIGYQSTNGNTIAESTQGYYFSHTADFTIAIDFDLSFSSASGGLGLGFGIGEEGSGENSAGVGLLSNNGIITGFAGASRINDVTQSPSAISLGGPSSGTLLVAYTAANGNIQVGYNTAKDANTFTSSTTLTALQNSWNDKGLLASFFIRSDDTLVSAWTSGTATGVFENFRVLNGTATAIPEPSSLVLLLSSLIAVLYLRRTR